MIVTGDNRSTQTECFPFTTPFSKWTCIKSNPDLRVERSAASRQDYDTVSPPFHENLSLVTVFTTSQQLYPSSAWKGPKALPDTAQNSKTSYTCRDLNPYSPVVRPAIQYAQRIILKIDVTNKTSAVQLQQF